MFFRIWVYGRILFWKISGYLTAIITVILENKKIPKSVMTKSIALCISANERNKSKILSAQIKINPPSNIWSHFKRFI
jgi:hypothetical protein